jgi:hypothetical protein
MYGDWTSDKKPLIKEKPSEDVRGKRNLHMLLMEMSISTATMEISMKVLQKHKTRTTIWSWYTTPGHISKQIKSAYNRDTCMFIAAQFTTAQSWNKSKYSSTDEYIMKLWYICTMEHFSHKEEWNYVIWRKMEGTGDHNVKWNKPDSERQMSHAFSQMWNLDP